MKDSSQHVCQCADARSRNGSSIEDQQCAQGHCTPQSLCKPHYRGLLRGNGTPYYLCPPDRFGDRCVLVHDRCHSNPCLHGGSCSQPLVLIISSVSVLRSSMDKHVNEKLLICICHLARRELMKVLSFSISRSIWLFSTWFLFTNKRSSSFLPLSSIWSQYDSRDHFGLRLSFVRCLFARSLSSLPPDQRDFGQWTNTNFPDQSLCTLSNISRLFHFVSNRIPSDSYQQYEFTLFPWWCLRVCLWQKS